MKTKPRSYKFLPISTADAETLRRQGGPVYVADAKPSYPCRQCLCDAEIGDELILVSHDPFSVTSPYRCASPIFLHRVPCAPAVGVDDQPEPPAQLTCRQLSVRSFDDGGMMIDAAVIDGTELDETAHRLFDDPDSTELHVHNVPRGCWATTLVRQRLR